MEMKIPSSIRLGGLEVKTIWEEELLNEDDQLAQAVYRYNEIRLQSPSSSHPIPRERTELAYCHELVHWIFFVVEEEKLRLNEPLVNRCARALHQILTTMEYDKGEDP